MQPFDHCPTKIVKMKFIFYIIHILFSAQFIYFYLYFYLYYYHTNCYAMLNTSSSSPTSALVFLLPFSHITIYQLALIFIPLFHLISPLLTSNHLTLPKLYYRLNLSIYTLALTVIPLSLLPSPHLTSPHLTSNHLTSSHLSLPPPHLTSHHIT